MGWYALAALAIVAFVLFGPVHFGLQGFTLFAEAVKQVQAVR